MGTHREIRMCPSILNADHSKLGSEISRVSADSDLLHLDVMDNIFVPNQTFTFEESVKIIEISDLPVDAHLMIINPDSEAHRYAEFGAASVTFHLEASEDPLGTISRIRDFGARTSIAIKPNTLFSQVQPLLPYLDMVLIMTVEPGFGGQLFMADLLPKIEEARERIDRINRDIWLQVDGGISVETIAGAALAGADTFVAGSAVYRAESPARMLQELRQLAMSTYELE